MQKNLTSIHFLNVLYILLGYEQGKEEYSRFYLQCWRGSDADPCERYLGKIDVTDIAKDSLKSSHITVFENEDYIKLVSDMFNKSNFFCDKTLHAQELRVNLDNMRSHVESNTLRGSYCEVEMPAQKPLGIL